MALTPKQARFIEEYLIDLNATQAAIRAGFAERTAYSQGQRLLKNVEIQEALSAAMKARSERTEITQDRVLKELARLAFCDIRSFYDENGNLKPIHELDDDSAAAIAGMELTTTWKPGEGDEKEPEVTKKIKLWDKKGSLELIGKHLKMFTDKLEHSGGLTHTILDYKKSCPKND